ncbi:sensor domain-containing protein [Natrarchaeobius oligotrophus]|uniref:Histidine kinase n=1 Tax=Natrarchaeobius chitinivorans TaxID=1679083 RepID=A0A3N6MUM0_NATCH|nr:sensor domain-containing protein [Natrarchaeobius chitinivorans]RQG98546.1 histidine kinase [Natrarchaeobius chitinivorans]
MTTNPSTGTVTDGTRADGGSDRSVLAAPVDPWTYRSLAYVLLAFPLGIAYLVAVTTGVSLTLGLSLTLLGPVALVVTLLTIVAFAWLDGTVTRAILDVDVKPSLPETGDGLVPFLKELALGRRTWLGGVYVLWKILLGIVGFVVLVVAVSVTTSLLATPFVYGSDLVIFTGISEPYAIDTLPRALGAAGVGVIVALATLYLSNLLGRASAAVAVALLDEA